MLGVACRHCHWTAYIVGQLRAWHVIFALGLHTRSDDVGLVRASFAFGNHTWSNDVES